jgi:phosphatidylinositol glycan class A protein
MRICLVSDFFYPNKGGVEVHIQALASELVLLGHKVCVVTHHRPGFKDVRYFRPGFRVYYCPFHYFPNGITAPTFFVQLPLLREILLREQIELVHTHQSSSPLAGAAAFLGRELGCRLVHTEHSLFGTDDLASININKLLKIFMSDYDRFIGVSSVTRLNLIIRGMLPPEKVHRIPNAIDTALFYPRPELRS